MILNRHFDEDKEDYNDKGSYKRIAQRDDEKEEIENDIRERKHKKENKKLFKDKDKKFFLEILSILIIIIILLLILIAIFSRKKSSKEENNNIGNNTFQSNEFYENNKTEITENITTTDENNENDQKIKEENEKINKIKDELMNVYISMGKINIVEFYEKYINQKTYTVQDLNMYSNIHINIGFSDVNIDLIIKHIASILYNAAENSFIHIHMMDAENFNYDTFIKLYNMIIRVNNSTEIIVYDARQTAKDFLIRADSVSQFSIEYAKLYAFKVIKDVPKIIFLDGDDCIVQKDLKKLYDINMDNIYARGISEIPSIRYSMNWMDKYLYDRTHYINGGVMLINMELCQKEDFYEKAIKLNNDIFYTKTEEPFQDILNVLMRRKIEFFHPKYNKFNFYEKPEDKEDKNKWYPWMEQTLNIGSKNNHFYTREELIEADNDPVIIHYIWDRHLNKIIKKYEEDKEFYGNLTGINN